MAEKELLTYDWLLSSGNRTRLAELGRTMAQYDTLMGFNGQEGLSLLPYYGPPSSQLSQGVSLSQLVKYGREAKFSYLSDDSVLTDRLANMMTHFYDSLDIVSNLTENQQRLLKLVNMNGQSAMV